MAGWKKKHTRMKSNGKRTLKKILRMKNKERALTVEQERSVKIFEVIKILMELGENDLAYQLRLAHGTHLRLGWRPRR